MADYVHHQDRSRRPIPIRWNVQGQDDAGGTGVVSSQETEGSKKGQDEPEPAGPRQEPDAGTTDLEDEASSRDDQANAMFDSFMVECGVSQGLSPRIDCSPQPAEVKHPEADDRHLIPFVPLLGVVSRLVHGIPEAERETVYLRIDTHFFLYA